MKRWRWVELDVLYAIHDRQLAEHGGLIGIRDVGAIESAMARPKNLVAYGGKVDAASLAAAYAYGLARNHGFADGNKRVAWIAARLFLSDNKYRLRYEALSAIRLMEDVAAAKMSEKRLAEWLRERIYADRHRRHRN
jgi:death on curing protein